MKITKRRWTNIALLGLGSVVMMALSIAPAAKTSTEIAGFYAFRGDNPSNITLIATLKVEPGVTNISFDENVLIEFNIDNTGDYLEDLVIQAIPRNGKMYFFGPSEPISQGNESQVLITGVIGSVDIDNGQNNAVRVASSRGILMFAGLRDNPFFFDAQQYKSISGGAASAFQNPGKDDFAGTNVMAVVIELPRDLLSPPLDGRLSLWVETKYKR